MQEAPALALPVSRRRTSRRLLLDRSASRLVVLGGLLVIASILAILVVIVVEVAPLFRKPTARLLATAAGGGESTPASAEAAGVDEYREVAYTITEGGTLRFQRLGSSTLLSPMAIPGLDGARVTAVASTGRDHYVVGTSDGRALAVAVGFRVEFTGATRRVTPEVALGEASVLDDERRPIRRLAAAVSGDGGVTVAQVGPTDLLLRSAVEKKSLVGGARREVSSRALPVALEGEVSRLAVDGRGEDLFVGTSRGQVIRYDLRDRTQPMRVESTDASGPGGMAITALGFLLGDRTLVVGDAGGGVSTWQVVAAAGSGERRLTRIHRFENHPAAVSTFSASGRDKGFATGDAAGGIHVSYGTSGKTLLALSAGTGDLAAALVAPKGDGLLAFHGRGAVSHWQVSNPHPEITLSTLLGKVWYEGYARPEHVWQSTGGTDDFEPKFGLAPLVYGTLKGTFYSLLVAVPLALLAALEVSEFMHPTLKAYVKPSVEIMAALPSVVLGFLAGLWLAPMVERVVPGLLVLPLVLPPAILAALLSWRLLPGSLRSRLRPGTEVFLLVPVVLGAAGVAFALGGLVEVTLLAGDYRGWLLGALGLTYDQRNSLVVGLAMGFAVIPIIFTIAEDALANVPRHLRAGSLALGANRWQTAVRIVLPTASPGIFSAVMIGFGRAVGETMIVLMATGNTPVMDWSIFNGFRALSANIAVELPEAPEGGTLFRVLFLAALLLFCLTFAINTVAELVRLKLRRRYRAL